jgi:hypothetical protein
LPFGFPGVVEFDRPVDPVLLSEPLLLGVAPAQNWVTLCLKVEAAFCRLAKATLWLFACPALAP